MTQFRIETETGQDDQTRIFRIIGPLTLANLFDFQARLRQNITPITIIDLSAVDYMDSAALGAIIGLHVSCENNNRRYALSGASVRIESLLRISHVDNILVRFPTVEEAERSFQAGSAAGG
jgi:anti-anti-sigma factor